MHTKSRRLIGLVLSSYKGLAGLENKIRRFLLNDYYNCVYCMKKIKKSDKNKKSMLKS